MASNFLFIDQIIIKMQSIEHKNPITKKLFRSNQPSQNTSNTSKKPQSAVPFGLSNDDTIQKIDHIQSRISVPYQFIVMNKNRPHIQFSQNNTPGTTNVSKRSHSFRKNVNSTDQPNNKGQQYINRYLDEILSQNSMLIKKIEQKDAEMSKMHMKYNDLQQRYHRVLQSIHLERRHFCPTCEQQKRLSMSQISSNSRASRANSAKSIQNKRKLSQLKKDLDKIQFKRKIKQSKIPKVSTSRSKKQ